MRTLLWPAAVLGALAATASCGDDGNKPPPTIAPFGLDSRPTNTTCLAKPRPAESAGVKREQMWPGISFNIPMYMSQAPGDDTHWYVAERGGDSQTNGTAKIRSVPVNATSAADVKDLLSVTVNSSGEGGMLGLAFHPQWPTKPELYLSYTRAKRAGDPAIVCAANADANMTSILGRFTSPDGGATFNQTPDEILRVGQPFTNHKAGTIQFGPDGMLYMSLGDGGDGNDTCQSGQNLNTYLGKILRLDVNAGPGKYNIPTDNPFVGKANAKGEIWTYGHRNPFRWSFDTATGDQWVGDVGQSTWEEIDRVVKGGNYGWNTCEGFHKRGSTTELCKTPGLLDPVIEVGRADADAIIGGVVYHGASLPALQGVYIYGDNSTGNVWALLYDANNLPTPRKLFNVGVGVLASFAQDHDGEVYVVLLDGTIWKIVPDGAVAVDTFPQKLSQTGCVDPKDPTTASPAMIPYVVNSPLWEDGADKERHFALPEGQTITITPDQDFDLPIGSVIMKTFSINGHRLETRLLMRHDDGGWAGYSYEWDDDGKDATLLAGGKTETIAPGRTWQYPSRSQCLQCHNPAAGGSLGLETAQLNGDEVYPSTNRQSNQLATLDHINVFSAPLGVAPAAAPKLPVPTGNDEPIDARARSYLHANCAICHRPGGPGQGTMDLRYATSFFATNTCNATDTQGAVNDLTKLLVPGHADQSIISARIHATDVKRMPPIAVSITDPDGSKLIDDWINQLAACPTAAAARAK
ncbi:MAG TPA: PQQ-dependent sugar dehydrogenase [Kofleriaceae bacterium]|nr:PQQ-dependent sugar dehydrogenase [Kofleriaceae bacterium]